jgi:hypothetical protein
MNTTIRTARRFGATLAIAGIAALGSVVVAPAASAAESVTVQDGPATVVERSGHNGPDAFIHLEHGRVPVFYCDEDKPNQRHNKCEPVVVADGARF